MLEPIAIIGIGCRFPGNANDPDSFWQLLATGVDAITPTPPDRWNMAAYYSLDREKPGKVYVDQGGFLEGIDTFDAAFFGLSPRAAAKLDPQQRLFLEVAWEALEDAGLRAETLAGTQTAVCVGVSAMDYYALQGEPSARREIDSHSLTGVIVSMIANRLSYLLDLRGPSLVVDTACSSSLVALHQACHMIWYEECPLALAGGVQLQIKPEALVMYGKSRLLSPSGRCYAFEARADGFVRSEGAGVLVLKPLAAALAEGDRIYALVRGTAVAQDGYTTSLTEPSAAAQAATLRAAQRQAGVQPHQVQYIEAHGTGTPVGDPIEAAALAEVLGTLRAGPCLIGSVKTNIGHTETAAGIAGVIKTALALHHRQIPPNLHFETPNPAIPLAELGLRVPTTLEPWPANIEGRPRLAGVNSFGIGGTNAHVVLAEAPAPVEPQPGAGKPRACLLPLSARSQEALIVLAGRYDHLLAAEPDSDLADICYNAALRRSHHAHRLALAAGTKMELREQLAAFVAGETRSGLASGLVGPTQAPPHLAFVFSGMGQQWPGIGRQLLASEPVFQEAIAACEAVLQPMTGWSIQAVLERAEGEVDRTEVAQVVIFAVQVGLAALWQAWGVIPQAVVGHSVGEVAAAYVAGVLSLAAAAQVVYHRSRLQATTAGQGTMLAVGLPAAEMEDWLDGYGDYISIAAINSPRSVTLAGEAEALAVVAEWLDRNQIFQRPVRVEVPYHSPAMEPLLPELMAALASLSPKQAKMPLFSTVTGQVVAGPELDAAYWARNIRAPVRFAEAVAAMAGAGYDTFLEVAAHPVLSYALQECLETGGTVLPSLRRKQSEQVTLLATLGRLYTLGYPLAWAGLYPQGGRFVRLPTYPWQRSRYWHEPEEKRRARYEAPVHPLLGHRLNLAQPTWQGEINLEHLAYLKEHVVRGVAVYPVSAYAEMVIAAGHLLFGQGSFFIENLSLEKGLFLNESQTPLLQFGFDSDGSTFTLQSSLPGHEKSWTRHASGKLHMLPPASSPQVDLAAIRRRCPHAISGQEGYQALRRIGYEYGPAFQGIKQGWHNGAEYLFELAYPEELVPTLAGYHYHPAHSDAYFNGALLAAKRQKTWLPVRMDQLYLYAPLGRQGYLYVRPISENERHLVLRCQVLDEQGRVQVELRDMHYQAMAENTLALEDHLYAYRWRPQPGPEQGAKPGGRWLIFSDTGGVGPGLAGHLVRQGGEAVLAWPGQEYAQPEPGHYRVNPASPEQMTRLLAEVGPCEKVVHLWGLDLPAPEAPEDLEAGQERAGLSGVYLAQALADQPNPPQVWLVITGLHRVETTDEINPVAASLWGIGRTLSNELSRLRPRRIDISREMAEVELRQLFEEIRAGLDEDEVALRGSRRYVHRLERVTLAELSSPLDEQSFYLDLVRPGTLEGLAFRVASRQAPGPGEVALAIEAAGLNFKDVAKALEMIPAASLARTYSGNSLGLECAGRVVAVGPGVTDIRPGDEVIALAPHCFGTYTVAEARLVRPKPSHLSFEAAATLPVVVTTAYYALHRLARLQAGERILIHAAAGGVGQAAIQLAQQLGAEIYATAGSPEKRQFLRETGLRHVFDSRSLTFAGEILALTGGEGVDVVLNTLPGKTIPASLSTLRPQGRFIDLSNFYNDTRLGLSPFQKGVTFSAFDLDQIMRTDPDAFSCLFHEALQAFIDRGGVALPFQTVPLSEASEAFRMMFQARHTGKIILTRPQPGQVQPIPAPLTCPAEASYLITGGFSGFGLATARWLVDRGAKHLVLVSRRGAATPEAQEAVAALEAAGATVLAMAADISQAEAVAGLLAEVKRTLPPLRGIFHAAVVYEDQTLLRLTAERFYRALAPKVLGAWHLHRQTQDLPLDYFVLYSSITAIVGSSGQGSYVAANLFLDALAHYRHHLGLPALSLNWGAIGEVGYIARNTLVGQFFTQRGLIPLLPAQGLALMGLLLQLDIPQVTLAPVIWEQLRHHLPVLSSPRFSALVEATPTTPAISSEALLDRLLAALPEDQQALVISFLTEQAAKVLGLSPEKLNPDHPLASLGFDSLMAIELSNHLKQQFGTELSPTQLLGNANLVQLARQLLPDLLPESLSAEAYAQGE